MHSRQDDKTKRLLRDGIAFCDYIINQEWDGIGFNKSEKGSPANVAKNVAWNTKKRIVELIGKDEPEKPLTVDEAQAMRAFFDSEGTKVGGQS